MSATQNISLKLGTIIKIISPTNDELHDKIFLIDYLDNNIVEIINDEHIKPLVLNINSKGIFQDTSIEVIEILSYPEEEGFARQNNLIPGKWISIRLGGDLPSTINGKIINLEGDMIEVMPIKYLVL